MGVLSNTIFEVSVSAMTSEVEAVIVGAGPAGMAAALSLVQLGYSKVCHSSAFETQQNFLSSHLVLSYSD